MISATIMGKAVSKATTIKPAELLSLIETTTVNLKVLDCSTDMGRKENDDPRLNFHRAHIKGA